MIERIRCSRAKLWDDSKRCLESFEYPHLLDFVKSNYQNTIHSLLIEGGTRTEVNDMAMYHQTTA